MLPLRYPLRSQRLLALGRPPRLLYPPIRLLSASAVRRAPDVPDASLPTPPNANEPHDPQRETPDHFVIPNREHASIYISNVFPIKLNSLDPRPAMARLREETLMEELTEIMSELRGVHAFRVESWEVARKDGGVFCHFSYLPPNPDDLPRGVPDPSIHTPEDVTPDPTSPASLFLPRLLDAAQKHGGWPHWAGAWYANFISQQSSNSRITDEAGHHLYRGDTKPGQPAVEDTATPQLQGWQKVAGVGRVWIVRGRQWTEDLARYPSSRLRVEFDGPDVSQEMLYRLFRPYGRLLDVVSPSPVPAGNLRFAQLYFSHLSMSVVAKNCLHGFNSPTKSADYDIKEVPSDKVPLSRLRIYYERPLKAHYIRTWVTDHPRISIPVLAFLIATLSYTFFDPIRSFFVRSEIEGVFNLEEYPIVRFVREKIYDPINKLFSSGSKRRTHGVEHLGRASWKDRLEAEDKVKNWLAEYPSTFIVVSGPPGSGKHDLVQHIIKDEAKPTLIIDCAEMMKAKTDAALVSALADQTGYWPVFSFLQSINGLIDLASVGLIGQKSGFATPIEDQERSMLDVVTVALKDSSVHAQKHRCDEQLRSENEVILAAERQRQHQLMELGVWHDGRLDCVAGNGVMSELGVGIEEPTIYDMPAQPAPVTGNNAPIDGEGVPPTLPDYSGITAAIQKVAEEQQSDVQTDSIKTLPIVVLRNFVVKPARGDMWNVLAEWGASLIENKVAHVIVIGEGSVTNKTLTQALPSKPLNSVTLSDADTYNSLEYVREKLSSPDAPYALSTSDTAEVAKLGGRMVDLEQLVYKVRSGQSITAAVDDIVLRNVIELRKAAFGDDSDEAKHLPWTRQQAWKIVNELAKKPVISYGKLLTDFPFKGLEPNLRAMEEHDLVTISYFEGRANLVRPGKPVFRQAFERLVNDEAFRAGQQIEYNAAVISKSEAEITAIEAELARLRDITADGDKLGVGEAGWWGMSKGSGIHQRAQYLLAKLETLMAKLRDADQDTDVQKKVFNAPVGGKPKAA